MRKLKSTEFRKASKIFADIFEDYHELYDVFFEDNKYQKRRIYQFFLVEIYESIEYVYEIDNFKAVCAIKCPNENTRNIKKFFNNPFNFIPFIFWTGKESCSLAKEYIKFSEKIAKKYYNPKTDCYIKNIGVIKSERNKGYLKKMINEICAERPIFLETHRKSNVEIYKKLGFEICEVAKWHGVDHYAMKRY